MPILYSKTLTAYKFEKYSEVHGTWKREGGFGQVLAPSLPGCGPQCQDAGTLSSNSGHHAVHPHPHHIPGHIALAL